MIRGDAYHGGRIPSPCTPFKGGKHGFQGKMGRTWDATVPRKPLIYKAGTVGTLGRCRASHTRAHARAYRGFLVPTVPTVPLSFFREIEEENQALGLGRAWDGRAAGVSQPSQLLNSRVLFVKSAA